MEEEVKGIDNHEDVITFKISCNVIIGISSPQMMKYHKHFKKKSLIILFNLGSTHNFINLRVVKHDNYFIYSQNNLEVIIGNRGKLACKRKHYNVKLNIEDYQMKSDMYVLILGWCNVILRAQWL